MDNEQVHSGSAESRRLGRSCSDSSLRRLSDGTNFGRSSHDHLVLPRGGQCDDNDSPANILRSSMRWISILLATLLISQMTLGQENSTPLTPTAAAAKVDQQVTVEFEVRSTGGGRNRYLNSEPDFSSAKNFTIFIPQIALPKFAEANIAMPDEHFYGKVIQVTG